MKLIKNLKIFIILIVLFGLFTFLYSYKFQIISKTFSTLGFNEKEAKSYSFSISERPIQIIKNYFVNSLYSLKQKEDQMNLSLSIKKGLASNNYSNIEFVDNNYYLNLPQNLKKKDSKNELEFSNSWLEKKPKKIWSINMSSKELLDEKSSQNKSSLIVQAQPKICGSKLIYVKQDGNVGALNYKTGERLWYKKYGNLRSIDWPRVRGFLCTYDEDLNSFIILMPTAVGVFCINLNDGSLIKSRCKNGKLGEYESRVSPKFLNNTVYVATTNPAGIQAYNFLNGKLIWHFDLGNSKPWNNFTVDEEKKLIFVNIGSPNKWPVINNSRKYKYSGSLLALNSENGKLVWQFQEHSKDTWNHDFVGQPILSPTKINGKDVIITFSKSGNIYFLNKNDGSPIFPLKETKISLGKFEYIYKEPTFPKSLADTSYHSYLGKNCKDCDSNTKLFGPFPPILKYERFFDGTGGGPQWAGATIDKLNNLLILTSNHNIIYRQYSDFIPDPLVSLPENTMVKKCISCHDSRGDVKDINTKNNIIPSLFLTTKIYDLNMLNNYLKKNKFHKKIKFSNQEFKNAYKTLNTYDEKLLKNKNYKYLALGRTIDITGKDINLNNGPFGKITAISLNDGKIIWQIPAGTYVSNNLDIVIGSKNFGAISDSNSKDGVSFFTGSFDKKIYAINNNNGDYLWQSDLPASGSALPFIYNTTNERWIFVIATGGRVLNDRGDSLIAFRQLLK